MPSSPPGLPSPVIIRLLLGLLTCWLALSSWPGSARADLKSSCSDSYVANQKLRKAGKLTAARAQLLNCAQEGCPAAIKTDCVRWLAELERNLPTFVVAAQDESGADLIDVRVLVDGALVTDKLDGRPLPIDPGVHALRFEHAGRPSVDKRVVIQQGMKNRAISVRFEPAATPLAAGPSGGPAGQPSSGAPVGAPPADTGADDQPEKPIPVGAIVALGVLSAAGFVVFGVLGSIGKSDADDLHDSCGPGADDPDDRGTCDPAVVEDVRGKLIAADVGLGVGIASFVVGFTLLLYNEVGDHEPDDSAFSFGVAPTQGGVVGAAGWRF